MAHLCCSIEMEPRTLNEGQLNHAREAAVDIIQKMDSVESSNAFIEGLKPVVPIEEMEQIVERRHQIQKLTVDCKETIVPAVDPFNDCACITPSVVDSPDLAPIREPLSAPF
ncbi:hypothetical protein IFM89_008955 [Coptis chinensis]|nr:hypothetical protein IFM89_008955 [Coptis chinensis]